jgi:hypothetical protein
MLTQRSERTADCGYSSLSIQFLLIDKSINFVDGLAEGREVLPSIAIQEQFVIDHLVGNVWPHFLVRKGSGTGYLLHVRRTEYRVLRRIARTRGCV